MGMLCSLSGSCSAFAPRSYISGQIGWEGPTYSWSSRRPLRHRSSLSSSASSGSYTAATVCPSPVFYNEDILSSLLHIEMAVLGDNIREMGSDVVILAPSSSQ